MAPVSTNDTPAAKPRPLWLDQPIHKVETREEDGDREIIFQHHFAALNTGNERLLHDREKDTERATDKMTKGRFRPRLPQEIDANNTFYDALVRGGGFRPGELPPTVLKLDSVPFEAQEIYSPNGDGTYHAGFFPQTVDEMKELDVERKEQAIERWFRCKGEVVTSGRGLKDISFAKAKGGVVKVRLLIGDPDKPAYRIKAEFRRPETKRRHDFRDRFAYNVDHTKGEQGKIETVISLREGIGFFDEHFLGVNMEPDLDKDGNVIEYSEVVFTDNRTVEERIAAGEPPRNVSAVEDRAGEEDAAGDGAKEQAEEVSLLPYAEGMRPRFIAACHPMWKVEMSAAAIASFKRLDRE